MIFEFKKVFAKNYDKWYRDCWDSYIFCMSRVTDNTLRFAERHTPEEWDSMAKEYLAAKDKYFQIILENWEKIEYFRQGDNAYIYADLTPYPEQK